MLTFGSLSEEGRSNGIQGDAIRNIQGEYGYFIHGGLQITSKLFSYNHLGKIDSYLLGGQWTDLDAGKIVFNANSVVPTASENRTKNRKIRVYKRIA